MTDQQIEGDPIEGEQTEAEQTEELSVSPLELFFDLMFVFAITQVAGFLREEQTLEGLGKGALILTMVYWGWSLFTWSLNATGTGRLWIRLSMLAAMATILLMSIAIPEAFTDEARYFAGAYFAYRMIGTAIYYLAASEDQRDALFTFIPLATLAATVALLGGFASTSVRPWIWVGSLFIDLAATRAAEQADWRVRPGHFAERYGLLVIVALGETVVAIGLGLGKPDISLSLGVTLIAAFVAAGALFWSYFDWVSGGVEAHLRSLRGIPRGAFARDAYTLVHLPLIAGIVLFSVGVEEATAHPSEYLGAYSRWILALGISLVLLAFVVATYRLRRYIPLERFAAAGIVMLIAGFGGDLAGRTVLILVAVVLVGALLVESIRWAGDLPHTWRG